MLLVFANFFISLFIPLTLLFWKINIFLFVYTEYFWLMAFAYAILFSLLWNKKSLSLSLFFNGVVAFFFLVFLKSGFDLNNGDVVAYGIFYAYSLFFIALASLMVRQDFLQKKKVIFPMVLVFFFFASIFLSYVLTGCIAHYGFFKMSLTAFFFTRIILIFALFFIALFFFVYRKNFPQKKEAVFLIIPVFFFFASIFASYAIMNYSSYYGLEMNMTVFFFTRIMSFGFFPWL